MGEERMDAFHAARGWMWKRRESMHSWCSTPKTIKTLFAYCFSLCQRSQQKSLLDQIYKLLTSICHLVLKLVVFALSQSFLRHSDSRSIHLNRLFPSCASTLRSKHQWITFTWTQPSSNKRQKPHTTKIAVKIVYHQCSASSLPSHWPMPVSSNIHYTPGFHANISLPLSLPLL